MSILNARYKSPMYGGNWSVVDKYGRSVGCYFYVLDGGSCSYTVIFQATRNGKDYQASKKSGPFGTIVEAKQDGERMVSGAYERAKKKFRAEATTCPK